MHFRGTVSEPDSHARWRRIQEYSLLWTLLVFLLTTNVEGESINVTVLKTGRRFYTSAYIDSYFTCNVCGGGIQWLVNGQDAGGHLPSHTAGSVSSQPQFRDDTTLRYTSILLSTRLNCMDVVLLVSQPEDDFYNNRPQVTCRGRTLQREVQVQMPIQQFISEKSNGTVTLTNVLRLSDIVSPNNSYVTHIYVCSTNESSQFWRHNGRSAGGFNGIHPAGSHEFTLLSHDPSISSQEAVLLVKRDHVELTSVLLLTDVFSDLSFTILCGSNTNYILSKSNDSSIKKEMRGNFTTTTSNVESGTTDEMSTTYNSSDDLAETESTTLRNTIIWIYFPIGISIIIISAIILVIIFITVIWRLQRFKQYQCRFQHTYHNKTLSDLECGLQRNMLSQEMSKTDVNCTTTLDQKPFSANGSNLLQHNPGNTIQLQQEQGQLHDEANSLSNRHKHLGEEDTRNFQHNELSGEIDTSNFKLEQVHLGEDRTRNIDGDELTANDVSDSIEVKQQSIAVQGT